MHYLFSPGELQRLEALRELVASGYGAHSPIHDGLRLRFAAYLVQTGRLKEGEHIAQLSPRCSLIERLLSPFSSWLSADSLS